MNISKDKAKQKLKDFYKKANQLIDLAGGEVKNGMLIILKNMVGELKDIKLEDLNKVKEMKEEDFVKWGFEKFYPGLYALEVNRSKSKEKAKEPVKIENCVHINKEEWNLILESIRGIGSIIVKMSLKMDEEIALQKELLRLWKGGQQ